MTREETQLFELLHDYASRQYHCFLAELFMNKDRTHYFVCFRPKGRRRDESESERFDCAYLQIDLKEAKTICSQGAIMSTTVRDMDEKLSRFKRQA